MTNAIQIEKINGLICAPYTPFYDQGQLNLDIIPGYAKKLIVDGVIGVFVNGSSGEGASMTEAERRLCAEKWVQCTPDDFKVIIHVGTNSVQTSYNLAQHAQEIGAWAVGLMAPTFPRPQRVEELAEFCAKVAVGAPDLPFYYYHMPSLTGVALPMVPFLRAVDGLIPNFAGIKYTFESLYEYTQCRRYKDGKYDLLHGQDETLLPSLALGGAKGCIGGTFNYASPLFNRIRAAFEAGDIEEARREQFQAMDMIDVIADYRGNIVAGKFIMSLIGLDMGPNRSPFQNLSDQEKTAIKNKLDAINFFEFRK